MAVIPLADYSLKLGRVILFSGDTINALLKEPVQETILQHRMDILDEEMDKFPEGLPPELKEKLKVSLVDKWKSLGQDYALTIINQSLQIACSFFESFLVVTLEKILDTRSETIISLSELKTIKLEEIIALGDYSNIIAFFKDKILNGFQRASTKNQFNKYFGNLGFDIQTFFNMSYHPEIVQRTYEGWDLEKLISIFDERHDVVHNDILPLKTYDELYIRKEYFLKIMWNLSIEVHNKYKIPNDLDLTKDMMKNSGKTTKSKANKT